MDMLDSLPMEAHAFRYSATVAALLFAAIGLWRIRVTGPPSLPFPKHHPSPPDTPHVGPAVASKPRAPSCCRAEGGEGGTPKERFTAYFYMEKNEDEEEKERRRCRHRRLGSLDIPKFDTKKIPTFQSTLAPTTRLIMRYRCTRNAETHATASEFAGDLTEVTLRRGRDLGWYRGQDLSALDGSVVRLWNGGLFK